MGEDTSGQNEEYPLSKQAIPQQPQRAVVIIAKETKGVLLFCGSDSSEPAVKRSATLRAALGREEQSSGWKIPAGHVFTFSVSARESVAGLLHFWDACLRLCGSFTDAESGYPAAL